jgi:hypothetical protein
MPLTHKYVSTALPVAGMVDLGYVDHFHNLQTVQPVRLVGSKFVGTTKDSNFWTEAVTGTGAVTQAAGLATITTGATANSTASYTTVRKARFIPATTMAFRFVGNFSNAGSANNIRQFGMYDAQDGLMFRLSGTTMNIVTRAAASDTTVAQASWSVNPTSYTLDANIHSFDIYCSYKHAAFYVDDILVHQIDTKGQAALGWQSLDLPATMSNANSGGGTANVSLSAAICTILRLGELETDTIYKNITGVNASQILKYGAGRLHSIIIGTPVNNATIAVYDNVSGTTNPMVTMTLPNSATPITIEINTGFYNGLNIVPSSTSLNICVVYE